MIVHTSADAPLSPVRSIHSHIWLQDMASGERTEVVWATKVTWVWTAGGGRLSVELIDDGMEFDPRVGFYGLYIELENGQTLGPFYLDDPGYHPPERRNGLDRALWTMNGPFMDRRVKRDMPPPGPPDTFRSG